MSWLKRRTSEPPVAAPAAAPERDDKHILLTEEQREELDTKGVLFFVHSTPPKGHVPQRPAKPMTPEMQALIDATTYDDPLELARISARERIHAAWRQERESTGQDIPRPEALSRELTDQEWRKYGPANIDEIRNPYLWRMQRDDRRLPDQPEAQ